MWKTNVNLDFSKINTYNSYCPPYHKDLHYKLLHYAIKRNQYTYKCSRDKSNLTLNCDYCNEPEDILHLFIKCNRIKTLWNSYDQYYKKLTGNTATPEQHILTLSSNNKNKRIKKLILMLTQAIMFEIWQSRNNNKYDKTLLTQKTITNKIKTQLKNILQTHYKKQKLSDTLIH